ncbi:acyl-CoA thioesterase [Myxococcaceae bacterium]|nr:acyl-CoA thioesterase [Myxococcaceae bacterium]
MSARATSLALTGSELGALFASASFHRTLGATISSEREGVEIRAALDSRFESIPGRLHGGVVASLLDSAGTWALVAKTGEVFTTVDLRVDYLRPTSPGNVVVSGTIVSCGMSVARASASLVDGEGRLCATATGTFVRVAPEARKGP